MKLLFKGGTIVTPSGRYQADLLAENGVIAAIGQHLPEEGCDIADVRGKLLMPGAIDAHTHLECVCSGIDTSDDYFSGTRAAACGGTTTVIDYLLQAPAEKLHDTLQKRLAMAEPKAAIDFAFHIGVSDLSTPELEQSVADVTSEGVTSFKAYMVYDFGLNDAQLLRLFRLATDCGGLVTVHAESRGMIDENVRRFLAEGKTSPWYHYLSRDEACAAEADRRVIALAEAANAPLYLVHLSDEGGVSAVREARDRGLPVFAETCPQYLRFTCDVYKGERAQDFVCAPPMKNQASQDALWQALRSGDIATVATDHCPFTRAEKDRGIRLPDGREGSFATIPNGCDGIETMYPYLLSQACEGRLSFEQAAAVCAANPARLFGLDDRKGTLRVGLDADIVVFDPDGSGMVRCKGLHGHLDHTIWEGTPLSGRMLATYSRGRLLCKEGVYLGQMGDGRFAKSNRVHFTSPMLP